MSKRFVVFVSSTYEDLKLERIEVVHALLELDCIPTGMEFFSAAPKSAWTVIEKQILECDYCIVISAGRYGSIVSDGLSYTEMEYHCATKAKKPTIALLHKDHRQLVNASHESLAEKNQLRVFHNTLKKQLHCRFWDTPIELRHVASLGTQNLMKNYTAIGWIRGDEPILAKTYPTDYFETLEKAKELWITGLNLRRFEFQGRLLKNMIKKGGTLNVILLSSRGEALNYAAQQDYGSYADIISYRETIEKADRYFRDLRRLYPKQVNIRTIDFPLTFGVDAVDIESASGVIYVRYYPLQSGCDDQPILVLRPHHYYWYTFYKEQLEKQWKSFAALFHLGRDLRIDRATDELVNDITALANKVARQEVPYVERQNGFLRPYKEDEYKQFVYHAEQFYVLRHGERLIGFVLAHSDGQIDQFGEEVYLHIKTTQTGPFLVVRQICIDPEFSRKGYGQGLYEFLFKYSDADISRYRKAVCFIWEKPLNEASEEFHRKVGWTKCESYSLDDSEGRVGIWEIAKERQEVSP